MNDGEPWLQLRVRDEKLVRDAGRTLTHNQTPDRLASDEARQRFVRPDPPAA